MTNENNEELRMVEFRANSVHFLKLVRNMETKNYFLMLRNIHESAEQAIVCSKEYKQKASAVRALNLMHEKLCREEKVGEAKGVAQHDYRLL